VPPAEAADPPTPARLVSIEAQAAAAGWNGVVLPLRDEALGAYRLQRYAAADAWFHVYRWAALFSEPEGRFVNDWMAAVVAAHLNYDGVAGSYELDPKPMGVRLSPGLQDWMLGHDGFSEQFFSNLKAVDHVPNAFSILDGLWRRSPELFARYSSLALAVALVYDVKPPPYWPHPQVLARDLPRQLANPAETFDRLVREDMLGRTFFHLDRLRLEELKFVVDTAAPAQELYWSEANVPFTPATLEDVYMGIGYRRDRAQREAAMTWSEGPYTLQAIRARGGICVDQAYFATEVGKARGVPTILFSGAGQDSWHAWFGYLEPGGRWRLDAGRYAEQRFIVGSAIDPETWLPMSDHELEFLTERFRALPSFTESRVNEEFAADFLALGQPAPAMAAARQAVNFERRNLDGWQTLYSASRALGQAPQEQEAILREGALAFTPKYPDLMRSFTSMVCDSLRARGETSLADFEERGLAQRLKADRSDLAIEQASAILARSVSHDPVPGQIATYNAILAQFAPDSGAAFFEQIVMGFAEHLAQLGMKPDARGAVERAREAMGVQPDTQVATEFDRLLSRLQD
jgi:hypothetical protein